VDDVLALLEGHGFDNDRLWFNASIEAVGAEGFRRLRSAYPGAIVQCPVDFLAPLVLAAPSQARAVLQMLAGWGINRFSVAWGRESTRSMVRQLEEWGYEVNLSVSMTRMMAPIGSARHNLSVPGAGRPSRASRRRQCCGALPLRCKAPRRRLASPHGRPRRSTPSSPGPTGKTSGRATTSQPPSSRSHQ
jgi:hypothetical protein